MVDLRRYGNLSKDASRICFKSSGRINSDAEIASGRGLEIVDQLRVGLHVIKEELLIGDLR